MNEPPTSASAVLLGERDGGPLASVGRGGVVSVHDVPRPGARTTVAWWVGAEDRWHRPSIEASTRDGRLGGAPVTETLVRVPGGDVAGRAGAGRPDGVTEPSIVVEVENTTAVPVAVAWVIVSTEAVTTGPEGMSVAGVGRLALTRPAAATIRAAGEDALFERMPAGSSLPPDDRSAGDLPTDDLPTGADTRAAALVVPLPHTATGVAAFVLDGGSPASGLPRSSVPTTDRLVAGWATHRGAAPRLVSGDAARDTAYAEALSDVLVGTPDAGPVERAVIAEARARAGDLGEVGVLQELLDAQRRSGAVESPDRVAATVALVRLASAWWGAGAPLDVAERLAEPVAIACQWLTARRRGATADDPGVVDAVRGAAGLLADAGQTDAYDTLRRLAAPGPPVARDASAAATVVAAIDALVRPQPDGLELAAGWTARLAGIEAEAHDVPTRWGRCSFGLRWHGARPALLWEVDPWEGRSTPPPILTAPAIDPGWSATSASGEALLAAPAALATADDATSHAPAGGTFS